MESNHVTNVSKSQFTFAIREGQNELAIQLNNVSSEPRSLRLFVKDGESGNHVPAAVEGITIGDIVTVPGQTVQPMIMHTADVAKYVAIELVKEPGQGGVSMRQRSSSSNSVVLNVIELVLK